MTTPSPGDRVTCRWCPGTRHGEIEDVYPATRLYDMVEISVRWNDGAWKTYAADKFVDEGFGTWALTK